MFSISIDIFYPSAGTVFSKEGVFQQPQAISLKSRQGRQMSVMGILRQSLQVRIAGVQFEIWNEGKSRCAMSLNAA
jgi:hypothetical protein